jgi:hypothetical protein
MLRASMKLVAFSAVISAGVVRADLGDITPKDATLVDSKIEKKEEKKPEVQKAPAEVAAPTQAPDVAEKTEVAPEKSEISPEAPAKDEVPAEVLGRFARLKKLCARVTEIPEGAALIASALKAKIVAHPYVAGAAAITVAAVVIYSIVAKAEKKSARPARR